MKECIGNVCLFFVVVWSIQCKQMSNIIVFILERDLFFNFTGFHWIGLSHSLARLQLSQCVYFHPQNGNHVEVLKEKLRLLKIEFEGIKDDLDRRGDKYD